MARTKITKGCKMSKIKCPFCQQELEQITISNPLGLGRIEMAVCERCMDKGVLHIMPIWDWQELIRTRKALDVAKDTIRHADWFFDGDYNIDAKTMHNEIKYAIKAITTLEQKQSAFVHNKIEFPEYNDNLLEEFDKQFFENGQDDDLTETALEQKDVK